MKKAKRPGIKIGVTSDSCSWFSCRMCQPSELLNEGSSMSDDRTKIHYLCFEFMIMFFLSKMSPSIKKHITLICEKNHPR